MKIFYIRHILKLFILPLLVLPASCVKDIPLYTSPADRPLMANEQAWKPGHFVTLAYHDVEDEDPDQTFVSVRTSQLIEQLAWLRENNYKAVSVDDILAARAGRKSLPERAVFLTFDDGYNSFYTRVLPILKAYNWPAVLAPVGVWMDTPSDQPINFGGEEVARERFLNWQQVAEIAKSGLVEIAAHTDRSHYGLLANPQGNTQPAAATFGYDKKRGRYESEAAFRARMSTDVKAISDKIRTVTGKAPRVWVWPYGAASGITLEIVANNGYSLALDLEHGLSKLSQPLATARIMPVNAPSLDNFAQNDVIASEEEPMMRVVHVDLDYVYDPDPVQTDRNLSALVQRIYDLRINTVFLQAFADPQADGLVREAYFPNRHLPMRADLFNRVAWQLRNRASVKIYAWMPVLSVNLDPSLPRVMRVEGKQEGAARSIDPTQYQRLSPFDARVRRQIGEIYEDLARHAIFDGLLFHDDALLGDYEDASDPALAAYREAGFGSIASMHRDVKQMQKWSRFKSRYLIDFTHELTQKVRNIRGPQIKTARNIFAEPILNPTSETWYAQNLDDFLAAYDWVAPMAMPRMENVSLRQEHAWLDRLVDIIATRKGALDKTVFELQARDWRTHNQHTAGQPIPAKILAGWMKRLQMRGVHSFGYYPDDFVTDNPRLKEIRPAISTAWYPFKEDK